MALWDEILDYGIGCVARIRNPNPSYTELNLFFRTIAGTYEAGISWGDAIKLMADPDQVENRRLREALHTIYTDIREGVSLADAFAAHSFFPVFCIEALRAGQETDSMSVQLKEVGKFLKKRERIQKRMIKAILPMVFILAAIMLSMFVIATAIIPKLAEIYASIDFELPWVTTMTMECFDILLSHFYIPVMILILLPFLWQTFKRRYPFHAGKFMFHIPLYKKVHYQETQYLFTKLMSLFLHMGQNPTKALSMAAGVIDNVAVSSMLEYAHYQVANEGESMADALKNANQDKMVNTKIISFIHISETTGADLRDLMEKAADDYDETTSEAMEDFAEKMTNRGLVISLLLMGFVIGTLWLPQFMLFAKIGQP